MSKRRVGAGPGQPERNEVLRVVFKQPMDYYVPVKGISRRCLLALAGLAFAGPVAIGFADTADNPYRIIAERNAFGLKPPVIPTNTTTEVAIKTDIKLTGIAKVNGVRKAYLATPDTETKTPGQFRFYEMTESRPDNPYVKDGIEVVEINEAKQTVKVRQGANEMVLDFEKHGFKSTAVPTPPPMAGRPGAIPLVPGASPIGAAPATTAAPAPIIISRGSVAADSSSAVPAASAARDLAGAEVRRVEDSSSSLTRIPTRQVRTTSGNIATPDGTPVVPQMSREEQYVHMEAVRRAAEQRGIPLPPTPPLPGMSAEGAQPAAVPNPTGK